MIEDIIRDLDALATLDERIAKAAASRLEAIAKKHAAAGVDPSGEAWKPRKKDGKRALVNAAASVSAESTGDVVTLTVSGAEYWHQKAKPNASLPQRKIIPDVGDALPADMRAELDAITSEEIASTMKGAS